MVWYNQNTGGGGGGGVTNAAEFGWVQDANGDQHFFQYDENAGTFQYFNAPPPAGTASTPAQPVGLIPTPDDIETGWVTDANGVPHWYEFNSTTGTTVYKAGPGGAATTPAQPIAPFAGGDDIETGWVTDANGVNHYYEHNTTAGTTIYKNRPDGAATTPAQPVAPAASTTASVERATVRSEVSAAGTVAAGATSLSFLNVGSTNVTVDGVTLLPDEAVNPEVAAGDTLDAVTYNAAGGTLHILEVR